MQLYVVRHGIAVEGSEGTPDGSRPLTEKGRRRFQRTARAFGKLGHKLDLILTSPLVRAVQTAEILAGATKHGGVGVLEELGAGFDAATLRTALVARAGDTAAVAIVGHEPQLSSFLSALCGVPQAGIDLKKGAIVRLDAATLADGAEVDPRWWLKPKGTRVKGLPLQKQAGKSDSPRKGARSTRARRAAAGRRPGKNARSRPARAPDLPAGPGATASP
jgi:phosphohistidine phosphatase